MSKEKLESTIRLRHIAALPYNPNFKNDVESIRELYKLNIGEQGYYDDWINLDYVAFLLKMRPEEQLRSQYSVIVPFKRGEPYREETEDDWPPALRWYLAQIRTYRTSVLPESYSWSDDRTHSSAELSEKDPFDPSTRIESAIIPFEKDVLRLMARYQIPFRFFSDIVLYVLTGLERHLFLSTNRPEITASDWIYKRGEDELKVTVAGMSLFTTKDDWIELWDKKVAHELELHRHTTRAARKRHSVESLHAQMKRNSEWYDLSVTQRLGHTEALRRWEAKHTEDIYKDRYDESEVAKAISDFEASITPVSMQK